MSNPLRRLRTCVIKILRFKGGHLMISHTYNKLLLKEKNSLSLGANFFLKEKFPFDRDAIEENHCLIQ